MKSRSKTQPASHRLLFTNVARMLMGERVGDLKLKGTPEQLTALKEAIRATQEFQDALHSESADLDSIAQSLKLKHSAAAQFERVLGVPWVL